MTVEQLTEINEILSKLPSPELNLSSPPILYYQMKNYIFFYSYGLGIILYPGYRTKLYHFGWFFRINDKYKAFGDNDCDEKRDAMAENFSVDYGRQLYEIAIDYLQKYATPITNNSRREVCGYTTPIASKRLSFNKNGKGSK